MRDCKRKKEKASLSLEHAVSDLITAVLGCTPYEPYETMKFFILIYHISY